MTGPHTDDEGWQYAKDFRTDYTSKVVDGARRRAWKRQRRITDEAPWTQVSPPVNDFGESEMVVSVGIGTNGLWVVTERFQVFPFFFSFFLWTSAF